MDEYEIEVEAYRKVRSIASATDQKTATIWTNHRISTDLLNQQISAYQKERDEAIRIYLERFRILDAERQRLTVLADAEVARIERESTDAKRQADSAWSVAFYRMQAVRPIMLMTYRAFLRLQTTPYADRLIAWIGTHVRPFVARYAVIAGERSMLSYHLIDDPNPIYVRLPSASSVGKILTNDDDTGPTTVDMETNERFWMVDKPPDRFDFGRFLISAANLTAIGRDLRCIVSANGFDAGIETREASLLIPGSARRINRRRRKSGILDYWLTCLPSDVVRLILAYMYETKPNGRRRSIIEIK